MDRDQVNRPLTAAAGQIVLGRQDILICRAATEIEPISAMTSSKVALPATPPSVAHVPICRPADEDDIDQLQPFVDN